MKVISAASIHPDNDFEQGLSIIFGVNDETCGAQKITTGRTSIAPGGRNDPHYHPHSEAVMYIIRGQIKMTSGTGDNKIEYIAKPGDFIYIPRMEVHGIVNCSESESAEWIFMYGGVPNKEAAGIVFV
jgi:uncharacterized RmlC-like cupin family protein